MTHDHLDADLVAAWGEGRLGADERATVDAHLAECADCRREAAEVAIAAGAARRRRLFSRTLPLAAAAALLLVVVWTGRSGNDAMPGDTLRPGTPGEGVAALAAWAPLGSIPAGGPGPEFIWGSDGPDALYDLTLADSAGQILWHVRTADTTSTLPGDIRLKPGAPFHWWVDVLLPDGRVASTGNREFMVRP